jgi:hypothetical protein
MVNLGPNKYLILGAVVAGLGVAYMLKKGAGAAVEALNPVNPNNIINQGAESLYRSMTGSKGTIGGDIYDATHDENNQAKWWWDWRLLTPATASVMVAEKAAPYVNPASDTNIINQGATSLYQSITGSTGTIGGDLYDVFH